MPLHTSREEERKREGGERERETGSLYYFWDSKSWMVKADIKRDTSSTDADTSARPQLLQTVVVSNRLVLKPRRDFTDWHAELTM